MSGYQASSSWILEVLKVLKSAERKLLLCVPYNMNMHICNHVTTGSRAKIYPRAHLEVTSRPRGWTSRHATARGPGRGGSDQREPSPVARSIAREVGPSRLQREAPARAPCPPEPPPPLPPPRAACTVPNPITHDVKKRVT